ncbi:MAG: hypothetical protein AAB362_03595 [Patescibacteria group bacterium]
MHCKKIQKSIALILVIAILVPIFVVPQPAQADLSTIEWVGIAVAVAAVAGIVAIVTGLTSASAGATGVATGIDIVAGPLFVPITDLTAKNVLKTGSVTQSAVQTTAQTEPSLWGKAKTFVLDVLAKAVFRILLKIVKDMIINAILTGNFNGPTFVQNFQLDFKTAGKNAARSFASQLFGINFCNFNPPIRPLFISISYQFKFQCTATRQLYDQYLTNPGRMMLLDRMLATDPSTNFIQSVIAVGQSRSEQIAQGLVSRSAQTASGFIGTTFSEVTAADTARYDSAVQEEITICKNDTAQNDQAQGNPPKSPAELDAVCANAGASVPPAEASEKIRTPGQTASRYLSDAIGADIKKNYYYNEFDQAIAEIFDVAFGKLVNDGLTEAFK